MRQVTIVAYDEQWPGLFEVESSLLQITLGKAISRIHHVGSTSVPGLTAKPVIDILLEVVSLNELDNLNVEMARAGYHVRGENGISNRRYFTKGGDQRSYPPCRSGRALLTHPAPTLGFGIEAMHRIGMDNFRGRDPTFTQLIETGPLHSMSLASTSP